MASKRKLNGSESVRRVKDAMKKSGCGAIEFFNRATTVTKHSQAFTVEIAVGQFNNFERHGVVMYPHYEIPSHILRFADMVHSSKCPMQFMRDLRTSDRPQSCAPTCFPLQVQASAFA